MLACPLCQVALREESAGAAYRCHTGYHHRFKAGVIDPTKVARVAIENAGSIAGMLLTTECVLAEIKEETPAAPAAMPGGMPGMY